MRKSLWLSLVVASLVPACDGIESSNERTAVPEQERAALTQTGPSASSPQANESGRSTAVADSDGTLPPSANVCSILRPCMWNPEAGRLEWATPPKATTEGMPLPPTTNLCRPGWPCAWNPTTGQLEQMTQPAGEGIPLPPTTNLCRPSSGPVRTRGCGPVGGVRGVR